VFSNSRCKYSIVFFIRNNNNILKFIPTCSNMVHNFVGKKIEVLKMIKIYGIPIAR